MRLVYWLPCLEFGTLIIGFCVYIWSMRPILKTELHLNLGVVFVIVQINKNSIKSKLELVQLKLCVKARDTSIKRARDVKFSFVSHSLEMPDTHETVVFHDTTDQSKYNEPLQSQDNTFSVHDDTDASLAKFLSRPVLIATEPWVVGSTINIDYDPWKLFFNNPKVQKKVDGFFLMRFDLKIKILINGTAFYYGKCLASYNPLGQQDSLDALSALSANRLITRSQRNHIVLDSCKSTGGEISCPYFHPNAYQSIEYAPHGFAFENMGILSLNTFTPLNNSNGSSSTVYIQIYAWAENVVLSVPTNGVHTPTAWASHSDEYSAHHRIKSKPVAVIAAKQKSKSGFKAKNIPEYLVATAAIVKSVSEIAEGLMFMGFSRPAILTDQTFVKNLTHGNSANSDAPECVQKLTLTSKQELTIDPRTVGLEPVDELQLSSVLERESYVASFDWSPSQTSGTMIWSARVTPMQVGIENVGIGRSRFTPTILSYVSQLFNYWTGDIEYRFSVVASDYHKGRLMVVYDPLPPINSVVPPANTVYSRIIDISELKDFTVRVAYSQSLPYCKILTNKECADVIYPSNAGETYGSLIPSAIPNYQIGSNGTISVFVLNPLLNPSSTDTGIPSVLVYSKACENFRFAGLRNISSSSAGTVLSNTHTPIVFESHSLESPEPVESTVTISKQADSSEYPLVWFGETFESLRAIMKRYNYYLSYYPTNGGNWSAPIVATTEMCEWELTRSNIPQYIGYDAVGGFSGSSPNKMFPGRVTSVAYIMAMFVGLRGGIRYKYALNNLNGSQQFGQLDVTRSPDTNNYYNSTITSVSTAGIPNALLRNETMPQIASGGFSTCATIAPVSEIELPYYSASRFSYIRGYITPAVRSSNPAVSLFGETQTHKVHYSLPITGALNTSTTRICCLDTYVSVGEDFQLFWLLSAPPTYLTYNGSI